MGDLVGHKKVLLLSTAVTALGSWVMAFAPSFTTFLIGSALQGAYVVWLPLEVAIIYRRTAGTGRQNQLTRRSAAILVGALELAVIIGALTSGALVEATSMTVLLALPAIAVTLCFVVIWFGIEDMEGTATGGIDVGGLVLLTVLDRPRDGRPDRHPARGSGQPAPVGADRARPRRALRLRPLRAGPDRAARRRTPAADSRASGRCS